MWLVRLIRYGPLFLWVTVVLGLSFGEASMSETSRFIGPLLRFFFPNAPETTIAAYHGFVRKCAHFIEYAILAFWALRAFATSSIDLLREKRFLLAAAIVFLVAAADEYHQSFEPSRTGSLFDALLDCAGGVTMIFLLWFLAGTDSHSSEDS